jgi:superfamily I DNA and RNA helicase
MVFRYDVSIMAITYPEQFPIINSHLGEAKVFQALKKHLSDEWHVYANVRFHQSSIYGLADIETDFIVAHPKIGIVVLEVKGGIHIRFEPTTQTWHSTNLDMETYIIKNPFEQARKNRYALLNVLKNSKLKSFSDHELNDRLRIAYGVVFPDTSMINGQLPIEARKDLICFTHHLHEDCEKHLIKLMKNFNTENVCDLNAMAVSILHEKLAPVCEIKRSLKNWIVDEGESILTLTQQQFQLLNVIQMISKASIYGCAGSGKTLLAIEKAKLESLKGKKVLFVCFNTLLGQQLESVFKNDEHVDAHCFHTIISKHYHISDEEILFNDELLMERVINEPLGLYDGLIMDEAQDFSEERMLMVHTLLKEHAFKFYFWDDHQNINLNQTAIPPCETQLMLTRNFRNTQKIFKSIRKHVEKNIELHSDGPLGREIEVLSSYPKGNDEMMLSLVEEKVKQLIHHEGLEAKDIAILSFKGKQKSSLHQLKSNVPLILFEDKTSQDAIKVDTVRRFKGLEANVVIIVELDDEKAMSDQKHFNDLCYVAFSRAIHHCIVIPVEGIKIKV